MHWSEGGRRTHSREDFPPHDTDRVRAFIAIRMNSHVEDAIASTVEELASKSEGVRWAPRTNLHVTLKFLGPAVDPRKLEPLAEGLHSVAAITPEFDAAACGIGAFPNLQRPAVIWVGLKGVEPGTLAALAARVENAAVQCGFAREQKHWNGHLTIGRVRDARRTGSLRDAAQAMATREFGISRIESLTLYRSHLSNEAARYEPMATFLLQRA